MKRISDIVSEKPWVGWVLFIATLVAVFLIGLFGATIIERRQEAFITQQVKPLPEWEPRNEVWGENFPREFERYQMTAKTDFASKHGGSGKIVVNHIGCQDCHDPKTMNLRITRPALAEAWQRRGLDITKASHQEMRSLVCAQCHVEYYFQGEGKYLTFPWDKGFSAEEMEAYYDEVGHVDWVHGLSKAPMLKAQHPDYEAYRTGVHAARGVSCADCHMPYRNEGGVKFTDHHISSPLQNIANSCGVCHRENEETLRQDVYARQDGIDQLRRLAEDSITKAHIEAKAAWDAGATEEEMKPALQLIRQAQQWVNSGTKKDWDRR